MECEKVRDRFSALLEKDLNPSEEREIKGHLLSCADCRRDLEQLTKTMDWLHSLEALEVPEGFLQGIYKEMEDRKRIPSTGQVTQEREPRFPFSFKLPIQAIAMVAIVFLVLYVNKMMPVQRPPLKDIEETKSPRYEITDLKKERSPEKAVPSPQVALSKKKDLERPSPPASAGEREGRLDEKGREETKRVETFPSGVSLSSPRPEAMSAEVSRPKEAEMAKSLPGETFKVGKGVAARGKPSLSSKASQEIVIKTLDQQKTMAQLHEMLNQFGGEIVMEEGNHVVVSLPASFLPEFEIEVQRLSPSPGEDEVTSRRGIAESSGIPPGSKKREPRQATDRENRVTVKILLIQE